MLEREVISQDTEEISIGINEVNFDVSNIASVSYFYQLKTRDFVEKNDFVKKNKRFRIIIWYT